MNEQTITTANRLTFKEFIFNNRSNRIILGLAALGIVIQFIIFKYFYPYANYIHGDSFSYLNAAYENLSINTYPIGYSKFVRLFSVFAKSDFALVAFQFLFIHSSVLLLLFTLFFLYNLSKTIQAILLSVMIFNPLFLHLANLVSSDGFFLSLSMIWLTLLLWIIHQPSKQIILCHVIVLPLVFTVRYNALIYPFISFIAFWLSPISMKRKIIAYTPSIILCSLFILFTGYKYKLLTGSWQYSPFSGWQIANNAMYTYRYVDSIDRKPVPTQFKDLDNSIRIYFDSTRHTPNLIERQMASTFYMWQPDLPLFKYRNKTFINDTVSSELKKWASMAPLYQKYGLYIISEYPFYFTRYFLWPNTLKYYAPPCEFLEYYNNGKETVKPIAQKWFGYKNLKITTRLKNYDTKILDFYPILIGVMNGVFLFSLLIFILLKGFKNKQFKKGLLLIVIFWFLNAGFSIFSTAAALRFLSFPILLTLIYSLVLIDWILHLVITIESE